MHIHNQYAIKLAYNSFIMKINNQPIEQTRYFLLKQRQHHNQPSRGVRA